MLIMLIMLSGCGQEKLTPEQLRMQYQDTYASARFRVRTYGGFSCEYMLEMKEGEQGFSVTLLEPSSVAGLRAEVAPDGSSICYEDVTLDALLPEPGGYAPADVMPLIVKQLREAMPASAGWVQTTEGSRLQLEYQTDYADGTSGSKQILLNPETLAPERAELYLNGALMLTVETEDFSLTAREAVASEPGLWYTQAVTRSCAHA